MLNIIRNTTSALLLLIGAGGALASNIAPLHTATDPSLAIPNQFIVMLKSGDSTGFASMMALENHSIWISEIQLQRPQEASVEHRFSVEGLNGYSGKFGESVIDEIRARPEVAFVEQDQVVYALDLVEGKSRKDLLDSIVGRYRHSPMHQSIFNTEKATTSAAYGDKKEKLNKQTDAPWGLSRVCHKELPGTLTNYAYPDSAGEGVDVYVIDTGINVDHEDFEGRAKWGKTIPFGDVDIDGNGHGTHCAGTIASKTFGLAKKAHVIAVKVLRTSGFGSNSDVLMGVEWAIKAAKKGALDGRKSAANMSLGGGKSVALDRIIDKAVLSGMHFAVAAGNDNEDACGYSPAAAEGPLTVGATNRNDEMTFFSNHGPCVDIFAPGMDIKSTWIGGKGATNIISGTSMASPHVAGVLALYLGTSEHGKKTPKQLKEQIIADANPGMISQLPRQTENSLLCTRKLLLSSDPRP